MRFDGFIGGTYAGYSKAADAQRSINLYTEILGPRSKSPKALYGTPGRRIFCALPEGPSRCIYTIKQLPPRSDRVFVVSGTKFYEIFATGLYNEIGTVVNDDLHASIAENPTQLFIASGKYGYIYNKQSGVFTGPIANVSPSSADFLDGFFIAYIDNSQDFQISDPNNGLIWDPSNFGTASGSPDNIVATLPDHKTLWQFGSGSIQVFYNSGAADFPFESVPAGFIEQGTIAARSPVKLDNSVFWVGGDVRGGGIVFRADGYRPSRISNHAIEDIIRNMTNISSLWAYGYQEDGHSFYVINSPDDNVTIVYDVATDEWHERGTWRPDLDRYLADRAITHTFGFNKHLVGNNTDGTIYESSIDIYMDDTLLIRRLRRAPYLSDEMKWTRHKRLNIDVDPGVGLVSGQGSDPQMSLRWSDTVCRTWSNERTTSIGKIGEDTRRAVFNRLGKARSRSYEMTFSDPCKLVVLDAFFETGAGKR